MEQYCNQVLKFMQSQYQTTKNAHIAYVEILTNCGISDQDLLEKTLRQLESQKYIRKSKYPACFELLDL